MSSDDWIDVQKKPPKVDGLVLIHAPTMNPEKHLITTAWYNTDQGWSLLPTPFLERDYSLATAPGSTQKI